MIADLAAIDSSVKVQSQDVFANTFQRAQVYNLQMDKVHDGRQVPHLIRC